MDKLSWQTAEYFHTQKTADWYWIVGIIAISIALIAVIMNNIIFGILVIVSAFTLSLFASRKPEVVNVTIDNLGITKGKNRYPYKELESFWVETRDPHPKILLKSKKVFMPFIVIFLEEMDPDDVKIKLSNYLPEEEHVEPLLEKILMYLGF